MTDQIIYVRLPAAVIETADAAVSAGLYKDRTEILRELVRNGMKNLLYHKSGENGGFCIDLKKIVNCCHDTRCKYHIRCKTYTES